MWDAGAVPDSEWTPTGSPVRQRLVLADGQERFVTLARPLTSQLLAAGHKPADVTLSGAVALSLGSHGECRSLCRRHVARATGRAGGDVRRETGRSQPARDLRGAHEEQHGIVTADEHDVFGDGTVILKAAPGHTPGHQVLYVKLPETGPVVLSGDLYHYPRSARWGAIRPSSSTWIRRAPRARRSKRFFSNEGAPVDPARFHRAWRLEEGA